MNSRRKFVQNSLLAGALGASLPQFLLSCKPSNSAKETTEEMATAQETYFDHIGLQLYTLRDAFAANPAETLEKVAAIGYKEIELHDVGLIATFAEKIKALGMSITSSHFSPAFITGRWDVLEAFGAPAPENKEFESIAAIAGEYGVSSFVMPMLFPQERGDLDHYKKLAETFNEKGKVAKAAGTNFCYHNHSFEFEPMGDSTPFDTLIEHTDPELVSFELDVFWTQVSGNDPVAFMDKHAGRISLLHLKDLKEGIQPSYNTMETASKHPEAFMPVGSGTVDFKGVLSKAAEIGVSNCYVEQDHSPDPFAGITASYGYLKGLGA